MEWSRPDRIGEKVPGGSGQGAVLLELSSSEVHRVGQCGEESHLVLLYRGVNRRSGGGGISPAQRFDRPLGGS